MINKKRIIKIVKSNWSREYMLLEFQNTERHLCKTEIERAIGKRPKVGMKLALVDLDEYWVPGINCD